MVRRAEALAAAGVALGDHALTAWHGVINGSVLLHESPHGYDQPMRGRYAYVGDSAELMHEGIARLAQLLADRTAPLPRVVAAPDRASQILGLAVATTLSLPLVPFQPEDPAGLIVAWDLKAVSDSTFLETCQYHAPDQLLFAHASSWVDPFPYAPDVTTFLYQTVTHPFTGGAMRVDPATGKATPEPPDMRDNQTLANEIVTATIDADDGSQTPLALPQQVIRALAPLEESDRLGFHRTTGRRLRQRAGSRVQSARFR